MAGNDMGSGDVTRAAVNQLGVEARTIFTDLLQGRAHGWAPGQRRRRRVSVRARNLRPRAARLLAGTPVVVADDSGCGEVIAATGGGLVVKGNADSLRSAIDHILDAPAHWRAAAVEAAKRVKARYASDVVCAQLEQVYAELAARLMTGVMLCRSGAQWRGVRRRDDRLRFWRSPTGRWRSSSSRTAAATFSGRAGVDDCRIR